MSATDEDVQDLPLDPETKTKPETPTATKTETGNDSEKGTVQTKEEAPKEQKGKQGQKEVQPAKREEVSDLEEGEGEEEEGEEEEIEEEEPSVYDSDDFISGPEISENGTLPMNILDFQFSFGYNCRKHFNLTVLDEETVLFGSGNFLNFFNVVTRDIWFRRSALGGAIGHIRNNPKKKYPYFAVAECGKKPIIIMYEWPTLDILSVLRGGATRIYTNLAFSADGELLVSQAGEPDFLITIWTWRERKILLRSKSYVNEVIRVKFSNYVPGQLTSCGLAHIKFWKMAHTFTGLKLKGELGRFGKTEYTDIVGVFPMPDEKVVSGSNWGNILIWDGGLIVLEVFRTQRRKCHDAPIVQFFYNVTDGELWSVSMDGHIRVWWYEIIDQADPPDDDRIIQLDPSYDFYTPGLMTMSIEKQISADPTSKLFYAQDGNGGIWLIDLNTEDVPQPSVQLFKCHAGEVADIAASPISKHFASLGKDGRLYLYDYLENKRVFDYDFPAKGVCMIWLPLEIQKYGDTILAGFDDGQIRVCCIKMTYDGRITMIIRQVTKPHNKPLTAMSVNPSGSILVSGGEDCTIFIYKLEAEAGYKEDLLTPIGLIASPDIVTCITWHYSNDAVVLVGCLHGKMMQVEVPYDEQDYTEVSYVLNLSPIYNEFKTYKAQIRRDIKIEEIKARKAEKLLKKMEDLERIKKENPGLEIDEEVFLADSESEEVLEPLHIPEEPNKILWLQYTDDKTIWLSMAGYDAGYIYEYLIDQKDDVPYRFRMVNDADDIEISSYVYTYNREYLIFAMQDGRIRINRVNQEDFRDLSDYWILSMHDNQNGFIPKMCFSYDEEFFFSCGHDGNVFTYRFQPEDYEYPDYDLPENRQRYPVNVKDIDTYAKLSLEDTKIKAENDRIQKLANEHKAEVREILKGLKDRFVTVLNRNAKLLPSQVIPREELELDPRVTKYLDQKFHDKLALVKRKLAYDLEKSEIQMKKLLRHFTDPVDKHPITLNAINDPSLILMTVRQRVMSNQFFEVHRLVEKRILAEQDKGRPPERTKPPAAPLPPKTKKTSALEYFLLSLSPSVIERNLHGKLGKSLDKHRQRTRKWDRRTEEWEEFLAKKPVAGVNHPDDEKLLAEAKDTIGDYKLKEADDFKLPRHLKETTLKKYKQLMDTRLKQYNIRHGYCVLVYDIREDKYKVRDILLKLRDSLFKIHDEIPESIRKYGPDIPDIDESEFPEHKLKPHVILPEEEKESAVSNTVMFYERKHGEEGQDIEEYEVLPEKTSFPTISKSKHTFHSGFSQDVIKNVSEWNFDKLLQHCEDQTVDTPFEADVRSKRLNRKVFMQDQTIAHMNKEIENFNDKIREGKKRRLPIHAMGNFIDIYILTLNKELNILKKCEDKEDQLSDIVNENLKIVHGMQDLLDHLKNKKENHEARIENFQVETSKIQDKFKHSTESNKFYDFLKKVFKKKYKPPKIKSDDDSSSESSSSSSSEEDELDDAASLDSKDFGIIRQDLNVCPKGCEQMIFNLTIELRTKRHELEQAEREEIRQLETVKKEIEMNLKKLNLLQNQYEVSQKELEEFQRAKQKEMNQVLCVVILHMDQIAGFNPENVHISDLLVFSKTRLTELYQRVGVLQRETYEQKSKYDTYIKHGTRMQKDINYMIVKLQQLKHEIVDRMLQKFGQVIDIDEVESALIKRSFKRTQVNELEEMILKKIVFDLRIQTADLKGLFTAELKIWQQKISKAQHELARTIKENTRRLELFQVISREKKELVEVITSQPRKRKNLDKTMKNHKTFLAGIEKLEDIIEGQCRQLCQLKSEIKMLKTKGLPPRGPICQLQTKFKEEEDVYEEDYEEAPEEEEAAANLVDFDKFIDEEYQESKQRLVGTDLSIPGFFPTESEDIVTSLINTLMESLDTELDKKETENMVKSILSGILRCTSVADIINEILSHLPFEPSDQQISTVEVTAEQLYGLQEPEITDESFTQCANQLLEDVIEEVMCIEGSPHEVVAKFVKQLIESLPFTFLMSPEIIEKITMKLIDAIGCKCLDQEGMRHEIERVPSEMREEMMPILDIILEKVFGMGLDYLYVIKR